MVAASAIAIGLPIAYASKSDGLIAGFPVFPVLIRV